MRRRKNKVQTSEGYKQSQITDFFKSSTSFVRRKLFVEGSSRSKMRTDTNSDSDFEEVTPIKSVRLPYPIFSDYEDTSFPNNSKGGLIRKKSTVSFKSRNSGIDKNSTMIKLNKPSSSTAQQQEESTSSLKTKAHHNSATALNNKQSPNRLNKKKNGVSTSNEETTLESFGLSSDITTSVLAESHSTPSKKAKMNLLSEDGTSPSTSKTPDQISNTIPTHSKTASKIENQISQIKISQGSSKNVSKRRMRSTPGPKLKSEGEQKLNFKPMELLKELFNATLEDKEKRELLTNNDVNVIEEFLKMDTNHQYFLMKLFTHQTTWRNMLKFCSSIKLDEKLTEKEIIAMYNYHRNNKFIYTDITNLSTDELLNMLLLADLKNLVTDPKKKLTKKSEIILYLKENCRKQSTLTVEKSSEDILREKVYKYLGHCVKLKEDVKSSFNKAYILQTYTNKSYYMDVQCYLKDMNYLKVLYPNYSVENFTPFKTKEQFSRFFEAILMKMDLSEAIDNKDDTTAKNICTRAFGMLKTIDDDAKWNRHFPIYIRKFSAEYLYIGMLNTGIRKLKKNFDDAKSWLEFLIKNYPTNHSVGFWYKQLAHITVHHYKYYETAAEIIIKAFQFNKKEDIFDFLQMYELNKLASKIKNTKSYKVPNLYCDQLAALIELPVDPSFFPKKFIKIGTYRSNTPGKRKYFFKDNEITFGNVETVTLKHYSINEDFKGIHCEGQFIVILFVLLFWDIIYEYHVPMTFLSKLQIAPLDMFTSSFYENRKEEIQLRLVQISSEWSPEKIEAVLKENWQNHSHEQSITNFDNLDLNEVLEMFSCIDRRVLSKILSRLAINFYRFRSGLPDLFLWNNQQSTCKFVEVKGEGDSLQPNQILWIQHLIESGADVEICHVSGVGANGKIKEASENPNNLEENAMANDSG